MSIKGAEEIINTIQEWKEILSRMHMSEKVIMHESQRLASSKTIINERGSLKDRLAQTPEEAEIKSQVEDARLGRKTVLPEETTAEQEEHFDEEVVNQMIDDFIEKTILKGM